MKRTPLYEQHCKLGGEIIDFGGWALPVQYSGVLKEHNQVRNAAGLFDVSHMGEITVKGVDAEKFLQSIVTNDISGAKDFQAVYSPMCYPSGGAVDDLLIYKYDEEDYLLIVNASNIKKDFDWLKQNLTGQVKLENVSDSYAQFALQGPNAQSILQRLTDYPLCDIAFFHFSADIKINGINCMISRSGYTGEDGFEIYVMSENASKLWEDILTAGKDDGLVPVGLGARDTLRFEVALPLYGNEISEDISPLEAGLGFFVKLDKDAFIGKDALKKQKESGLKRKLIGFEMVERGIARSHYDVQSNGRSIGFVTTGSFSPTLSKSIGLAIVETEYSEIGTNIDIVIRNKPVKAKVVKKPFYSKKYRK